METKRCPRCHKLLRADAQNCRRCGAVVASGKVVGRRVPSGAEYTLPPSRPTSPPASPHQAGHYSGLHPEDQPFQSSFFLRVQRPLTPESRVLDEETPLQAVGSAPPVLIQPEASWHESEPGQQELFEQEPVPLAPGTDALPDLPTFAFQRRAPEMSQAVQPSRRQPGRRAIPLLLTVAMLCFLLASSLLAFLLIGKAPAHSTRPGLQATPSTTVVAHETPRAGPPNLQLGVSRLDLGAGDPGTLTRKSLTLTNAGGGEVNWQARSNAPWLSLNPSSGTFTGSSVVVLTIDRANLAPQAYLGQLTFTQAAESPQILYVSMLVNTAPANLVLSTNSLTFDAAPTLSPASQSVTLQNNGGQPLDWTAGSTTSNGGDWLAISPNSGHLEAGTSAVLAVSVTTLNMPLGAYQGALSFSYAEGTAQQVSIALTVSPPHPIIHLTPQGLNFAARQGFNPAPQSFTVSNTGSAPLNWKLHTDGNGLAYLSIAPTQGSLAPGQSARVTVAPILGSANGTIRAILSVQDSDAGTSVPGQQLPVVIAVTDEPIITVITGRLEFDLDKATSTSSAFLIFSNAGSLPLNWSISTSAQVPWLSLDATSGILAANSTTYINVSCASAQMQPGTYTVTLTLKDTSPGSVVTPQTVTVTLIVTG